MTLERVLNKRGSVPSQRMRSMQQRVGRLLAAGSESLGCNTAFQQCLCHVSVSYAQQRADLFRFSALAKKSTFLFWAKNQLNWAEMLLRKLLSLVYSTNNSMKHFILFYFSGNHSPKSPPPFFFLSTNISRLFFKSYSKLPSLWLLLIYFQKHNYHPSPEIYTLDQFISVC